MQMTIPDVAKAANVTEKTVREWIREHGCPTVKDGGKGAGNGAVVDGARFPYWLREFRNQPASQMAEFFHLRHPGRNPLRDAVNAYRECALSVLAHVLAEWASKPAEQEGLDYRKLGLTRKQARAVAWQVYGLAAMSLTSMQTERFDDALRDRAGDDLDDLFSMLTEGDFRTDWPEALIDFPDSIAQFAPREVQSRLNGAANAAKDE